MTQFYHDRGMLDVEQAARAICVKMGIDPDARVLDNGYADSATIPAWYQQQDTALAILAVLEMKLA